RAGCNANNLTCPKSSILLDAAPPIALGKAPVTGMYRAPAGSRPTTAPIVKTHLSAGSCVERNEFSLPSEPALNDLAVESIQSIQRNRIFAVQNYRTGVSLWVRLIFSTAPHIMIAPMLKSSQTWSMALFVIAI